MLVSYVGCLVISSIKNVEIIITNTAIILILLLRVDFGQHDLTIAEVW